MIRFTALFEDSIYAESVRTSVAFERPEDLTSILVNSASLINLSKSSFFHACSTTAGRGVAGTGFVLAGCAILLTLGDARFGDIPFPTGLDRGEFLTEDFLP